MLSLKNLWDSAEQERERVPKLWVITPMLLSLLLSNMRCEPASQEGQVTLRV